MTTQLPSYRTIGGATITIALNPTGHLDEQTTATCQGCGDQHDGYGGDRRHDSGWRRQTAERSAKTWAQDHAEKCLALPRLPNDVIHRAKTFGGGHIDITTNGTAATATCTGCPETFNATRNWPDLTDQERHDQALRAAREWARDHAGCPFIPGAA
jgi:hypothetical protein